MPLRSPTGWWRGLPATVICSPDQGGGEVNRCCSAATNCWDTVMALLSGAVQERIT
ncbi:MAG: hypothetical protein OXF25_03710 [Cyanobacteria bacterium MAG CAR3_bin_5]|nr:hypothetical protein [Cyanobacteria bacterium MAG CAR3_bin_5]